MSSEGDTYGPHGQVHVLDWYSRRQTHVCRSTFAAELHGVLDAVNTGMLIQMVLTEVIMGCMSAEQLERRQRNGELQPPLEAVIDAKAVFDSITAKVVAPPADKHLFLCVLKLREFLDRQLIDKIWWGGHTHDG